VGHTHSTTLGPTGKLDAEEGERGGEGCPPPQPNRGLRSVLYAPQREKYITTIRISEISRRPL